MSPLPAFFSPSVSSPRAFFGTPHEAETYQDFPAKKPRRSRSHFISFFCLHAALRRFYGKVSVCMHASFGVRYGTRARDGFFDPSTYTLHVLAGGGGGPVCREEEYLDISFHLGLVS